jgi:serine protease Do
VNVQPRLKSSSEPSGALVGGVIADSPAAQSGLQSGDLLLSVNNQPVDIRFSVQLPDFNLLTAALPIGQPVPLTVKRGDELISLEITPVEREPYEPRQYEQLHWGITIRDISFMMAKELKRASRDGVLVTSVRPGGPAGEARPAILENDVIMEVEGKPVKSVQEFREITEAIIQNQKDPKPILTGFDRKMDRLITAVKVGLRDLNDPGLEVKKAWLPAEYQVITRDIAELFGRSDMSGFRVTQVYRNSTAEKAGLKVGDLILAVDDETMSASSPEHYEELPAYIRQYAEGDTVSLKILRDGEEKQLPVELMRAPKLAREMKKHQDEIFEFTVRDITFFDRAVEQWEEGQIGVLVEQVKPGGWAALGQLAVSDLIIAIDGESMDHVDKVKEKMKSVIESAPTSVVFKVKRGIRILFLELEPKWDAR